MLNIKLLSVLMLMVVFSPLAIDIFLPALPIMAEQLETSLTTMQSSVTIFLLAMGFGQFFSGPLADKFGRRPVALVGVCIYFLSSLLCAYANSVELHLFSRLLTGLGTCGIVVAAFAVVRDHCNAVQSGMMYSYLNGVICCIPALAPILGGWLTTNYGWQSNFVFMSLFSLFAGVIIFVFLKESNPHSSDEQIKLVSLSRYKSIITNPVFLFHGILVMLSMAVIIAYVSSSPAWLMVALGLNQDEFIFWFSINAVVNIFACLSAPKILQKIGAFKTINIGMTILVAGGLLMFVSQDVATASAFMLPIMLSSIGFSLIMGTSAGQALAPFANKAGTASALLGVMQMSGSAIVVLIIQSLNITIIQQISLLMLSIFPLYLIWNLKRFNSNLVIEN